MCERPVGHRLKPPDTLGGALRIGARPLLAGEQLLAFGFGLLAVMNICRGSAPLDDLAPPVTDWDRACQVPTILAVFAAKTELDLVKPPDLDRLCPLPPHALKVVGMKRLHPSGSLGPLPGDACILFPSPIDIIDHSVGAAGVKDLWHGVRVLA